MNAVYPQKNSDCCLAILLQLLDLACLLLTHLLRMCIAACLLTGSSWHWCLALPADNPARDVLLPTLPIAHPVAGHPLLALLLDLHIAGFVCRCPCCQLCPLPILLPAVHATSPVYCRSCPIAHPQPALPVADLPAGPACCWPCHGPCP